MENFLQLRRGLLEHVESGRITSDEFAAFVYITAKAKHQNGAWRGCGETLARAMHWGVRKAQYVLAALTSKGYFELARVKRHYGSYLIRVHKYFGQKTAQPSASISRNGAAQCVDHPITAHQGATLQEVKKQEELRQEENRAPPRGVNLFHLAEMSREQKRLMARGRIVEHWEWRKAESDKQKIEQRDRRIANGS